LIFALNASQVPTQTEGAEKETKKEEEEGEEEAARSPGRATNDSS